MRFNVGGSFQRTKKPNIQTKMLRRKACLTLSGRLFFMPIFNNGALKTAPYEARYV